MVPRGRLHHPGLLQEGKFIQQPVVLGERLYRRRFRSQTQQKGAPEHTLPEQPLAHAPEYCINPGGRLANSLSMG